MLRGNVFNHLNYAMHGLRNCCMCWNIDQWIFSFAYLAKLVQDARTQNTLNSRAPVVGVFPRWPPVILLPVVVTAQLC